MTDKDKELKHILVSFKIGDINMQQARYKISQLYGQEEISKQVEHNIADEKWEEI